MKSLEQQLHAARQQIEAQDIELRHLRDDLAAAKLETKDLAERIREIRKIASQ